MLVGLLVTAAMLLATTGDAAPAFGRYPARLVRIAHAAPPKLATPLDRRFRTTLREAAHGSADFAGHFVLATIGCGAGCIRLAAIDRATGRVAWFPATVSGWPIDVVEPLAYRLTSRLLVVTGKLDEQAPVATRRYVFDGARFVLLPG